MQSTDDCLAVQVQNAIFAAIKYGTAAWCRRGSFKFQFKRACVKWFLPTVTLFVDIATKSNKVQRTHCVCDSDNEGQTCTATCIPNNEYYNTMAMGEHKCNNVKLIHMQLV